MTGWHSKAAGACCSSCQLALTALLVTLAVGLSVYVGNAAVLAVVFDACFAALLVYGYVTRQHVADRCSAGLSAVRHRHAV